MLTKRGCLLIWLALCVYTLPAHAEDVKIHTAKLAPSMKAIWVQFETPVNLTDCQIQFPTDPKNKCTTALVSPPWEVVVYSPSPNPSGSVTSSPASIASSSDLVGNLAVNGLVEIDLESPIASGYTRIDVIFTPLKGAQLHFSIESKPATNQNKPGTKPSTSLSTSPPSKQHSTVYLSGTFSPAEGSSPTYAIDSQIDYQLHSFEEGAYTISALGSVKTANEKTADPDSFQWTIPVQYVSTNNFSIQFPTIGMQADKKGNALGLVSAPGFTYGFSHPFTTHDAKHSGADKVIAAFGLDISLGLEFGSNIKNDYAVANKTIGGQGWFLRGAPSAMYYLTIPSVFSFVKNVTLTSSYTARIPTTDEVFIETRHTAKPTPELSDRTRNYVENSLQFKIGTYTSIQIKRQYGSLPPAFKFVQNSGSIGLIFNLGKTDPTKRQAP